MVSTQALSLTIEDVQKALERRPDAKWKAADNDKAVELGIEGRTNPFGLEPQEPVLFDVISTEESWSDPEIPNYWDWRNINGKNFVSPIQNQGACGSCVAFASIAALETQFNISYNNPSLNLDLSEQNLFSNIGGCGSGSWPEDAHNFLKSNGVSDETCQPYISGRLGEDQSASAACSDVKDRRYKITKTESFLDSSVKTGVLNGPLVATMNVYEDLMFYKEGIYSHVTGKFLGGHAVTIVGYDDASNAWIVKNSWGIDWGENGFFRIKRDDVSGLGISGDLYVLDIPKKMIKLVQPVYFGAMTGQAKLIIQNLADQNIKEAKYEIKNIKISQKIDGTFVNNQALVDTTKVDDGIYQIKVFGSFADGSASYRPWFSMVIIKNKPTSLTISLAPDFPSGEPVTGRVYFSLKTQYDTVPLTDAVVYFKKKDGSYQKEVKSLDPGEETKVGWRTAASPNGVYDVYAVGNIGQLQSFQSGHLTVEVKN